MSRWSGKELKDEGKPGGHQGVLGRRSPRWAINSKMLIPCHDGSKYLFRRRLIQTPWFGVYLHDIFREDKDYDPHDHPWTFISIVLRGWYKENLHLYPNVDLSVVRQQHWKRFSAHKMNRETAHRITEAHPKLKTLILVGPRQRDWGFFTKPWGGWVPWQDYVVGKPNRDHTQSRAEFQRRLDELATVEIKPHPRRRPMGYRP